MRRLTLHLGPVRKTGVVSFLLLLLAAFLITSVPAQLDSAAAESVEIRLASLEAAQTGLEVNTVVYLHDLELAGPFSAPENASVDPFETPAPFDTVTTEFHLIELPRYEIVAINTGPPRFPSWVTARVGAGAEDRITVIDAVEPSPVRATTEDGVPVVDVYLTTATAETLGVTLGEVMMLRTDATERTIRAYDVLAPEVVLRVTEIVEVNDSDDPYWWDDNRLEQATVNDTVLGADIFAFVGVRMEAFVVSPWVGPHGGLGTVVRRVLLGDEHPTTADTTRWLDSLERMGATTPGLPAIDQGVGATGLTAELRRLETARKAALSSLTLLASALAAAVGLAVFRTTHQSLVENRTALALLRARGASWYQLTAGSALRGLTTGLLASTLGIGGAVLIADATLEDAWSLAIVLSVGAAALSGSVTAARIAGPLAAELQEVEISPGQLQRGFDLVVLVATAVAVVSVVRDGGNLDAGIDPMSTVAFVGLAMSAAVVARWSLQLASGWIHSSSLGLDLGLRRIAAGTSFAPAMIGVIAVVVLTVGFGAGVRPAIDQGVQEASWATVGGPVRIEAALGTAIDEDALSSLDNVGLISGEGSISGPAAPSGGLPTTVTILAVDTHAAVVLTDADPSTPYGSVNLDRANDGRVPVLVPAAGLVNQTVAIGTELDGVASFAGLDMEVVGYHSINNANGPAVIADRQLVEAAIGREIPIRAALLEEGVSDEALGSVDGVERVIRRSDVVEELASSSQTRTIGVASQLIWRVSVAVALTVAAMTTALVSAARRSQSALLEALGMSRMRGAKVVLGETLVVVVVAILAGLVALAFAAEVFSESFDPAALVLSDQTPQNRSLQPFSGTSLGALIGLSVLLVVGVGVVVIATKGRLSRNPAADLREEVT